LLLLAVADFVALSVLELPQEAKTRTAAIVNAILIFLISY
jgi:hypothetical protein